MRRVAGGGSSRSKDADNKLQVPGSDRSLSPSFSPRQPPSPPTFFSPAISFEVREDITNALYRKYLVICKLTPHHTLTPFMRSYGGGGESLSGLERKEGRKRKRRTGASEGGGR